MRSKNSNGSNSSGGRSSNEHLLLYLITL
jgi:hypothetical protein